MGLPKKEGTTLDDDHGGTCQVMALSWAGRAQGTLAWQAWGQAVGYATQTGLGVFTWTTTSKQ